MRPPDDWYCCADWFTSDMQRMPDEGYAVRLWCESVKQYCQTLGIHIHAEPITATEASSFTIGGVFPHDAFSKAAGVLRINASIDETILISTIGLRRCQDTFDTQIEWGDATNRGRTFLCGIADRCVDEFDSFIDVAAYNSNLAERIVGIIEAMTKGQGGKLPWGQAKHKREESERQFKAKMAQIATMPPLGGLTADPMWGHISQDWHKAMELEMQKQGLMTNPPLVVDNSTLAQSVSSAYPNATFPVFPVPSVGLPEKER